MIYMEGEEPKRIQWGGKKWIHLPDILSIFCKFNWKLFITPYGITVKLFREKNKIKNHTSHKYLHLKHQPETLVCGRGGANEFKQNKLWKHWLVPATPKGEYDRSFDHVDSVSVAFFLNQLQITTSPNSNPPKFQLKSNKPESIRNHIRKWRWSRSGLWSDQWLSTEGRD